MKKKLLITIVMLLVVLGGAVSVYTSLGDEVVPETTVTDETGEAQASELSKAPDIKVYDAAGDIVTLSEMKGKPVVLNFWASWCGPCQNEMPVFNEKYLELGDEIHFLMVNLTDGMRETQVGAMEFIAEKGFEFPVYFDLDITAKQTYQAYSIPVTFFIDADGYLVAQASGTIDTETLQKGIDMITE